MFRRFLYFVFGFGRDQWGYSASFAFEYLVRSGEKARNSYAALRQSCYGLFTSGLKLTLTSCKKVLCNIKKHIDKFGFEVYTYIKKF